MRENGPRASDPSSGPAAAGMPMSGEQVAPSQVRYIKLGPSNAWEARSLERGEIYFSESPIPRELADARDFDGMRRYLRASGSTPAKASDLTREVEVFFTLGSDCLWVTFARGHLWWAFAEPEVQWVGGDGSSHGQRLRRTIGGWHNTDVNGRPLRILELSTRLTKVAAYRQTICRVSAETYLLDRINGRQNPIVAQGEKARADLIAVAEQAIAYLDWSDFETMVDLIFARAGFQRVSAVGGVQADVDLVLEHPATGERSFVQVKSAASQGVLADYLARFDASALDRMFLVCHSPAGALAAEGRKNVHLWTGSALAQRAVDAGLFGWLMDRMK